MLSLIKFVGIPPFLANVIGFIFAVIQNFILNRTFTFPEFKDRRMSEQVVKFIFVSLVGLTINMPIFILVDSYLRPSWTHWLSNSELGFNVSYQFAKLTAIAVVMLWNFTANRLWTFKSHI